MKKTYVRIAALLPAALLLFLFTSCGEKKSEEPKKDATVEQQTTPAPAPQQTPAPDTAAAPATDATPQPEATPAAPDITGTWSGTLDSRPTRLTIAKQEGTNFEGSIFINYREPINQKVSGTIDFDTKKLRMRDLLHSRYKGTYSGTLGNDFTTMKGSFTATADKRTSSFSLKKK